MEINLLTLGKWAGLNFAEMNELSVNDLLAFVNTRMGKDDEIPNVATQDDIDKFYGR